MSSITNNQIELEDPDDAPSFEIFTPSKTIISALPEYQGLALRTEAPLPTARARFHHAMLGMITEVGEFATEVKRSVIYNKKWTAQRLLNLSEELGDYAWYAAIATSAVNVPLVGSGQFIPEQWTRKTFNDRMLYAAEVMAITNGFLLVAAMAPAHDTSKPLPDDEWAAAMAPIVKTQIGTMMDLLDFVAFALAVHAPNCDLSMILGRNIDKLILRFPDAYSDAAAEARADKGGLDARSS